MRQTNLQNPLNQTMSFTLRFFLGFAAIAISLLFMRTGRELINATFLAYIVVIVASPLLAWLKSKRAPNWLAFLLTLLTIAIVFIGLSVFLITALSQFVQSLPTYAEELESLKISIQDFFTSLGLDELTVSAVSEAIDPGNLLNAFADFLGGIIGVFSNVLLIALLVIFLLVQMFISPAILKQEIDAGNNYVKKLTSFGGHLRKYFLITTLVGLVAGTLDTILFLILGIPFAPLWGMLAFLLSFVPTIGFWLAAIPPSLLALLEYGPGTALICFVGIVLINGFADNVVKPKYMGEGLNLAPFMITFSIVFWVVILGPFGAILAVPMTMVFKELVLEFDERNAWIARLMGKGGDKSPAKDADEPQAPLAVEAE